MGNNSSRRKPSSAKAVAEPNTSWIPTLKFRKIVKGPNVQQDEETTWVLQIWRDDSFMFRQQSTVVVPKDFRDPVSSLQAEIVEEITYFGSAGRVQLVDKDDYPFPNQKLGSAFSYLQALQTGAPPPKDLHLPANTPCFVSLRTHRVEFKKRHQRPAHLPEITGSIRRKSVVPDKHGLLKTIFPESAENLPPAEETKDEPKKDQNKRQSSRRFTGSATVSGYPSSNAKRPFRGDDVKHATLSAVPDIDEAFDWEWECDGIIDESTVPGGHLGNFFPPRVVDTILSYYAPPKHTIDPVAPHHQISAALLAIAPHRRATEIRPGGDHNGLPARANTLFASSRAFKRNPNDADFIASPGCLRITAELPGRGEFIRISHLPLSVSSPAVKDDKGSTVDPDADVTINYIKEPSPEPISPPRFEVGENVDLQLDFVAA
jgi:hypothetical protein